MNYFPQLLTGALVQYPLRRARGHRTVVNDAGDGTPIRYADTDYLRTGWEFDMSSLTDSEAEGVEDLFALSEGRLRSFTFCDPADNLLCWSEDYSNAIWVKDPSLTLVTGVADPQGGTSAVRVTNSSGAVQKMRQSVPLPASYVLSFSIHARSSVPGILRLGGSSENLNQVRAVALSATWTRVHWGGSVSGAETPLYFGVELAAGQSVELFGAQLEPQPAMSRYKSTTSACGIYPNARFGEDHLRRVATENGRSSMRVRIVTQGHI